MTRNEHLEFCSSCRNRAFDPKQGIICGLTGKIADFDPVCEQFDQDPEVGESGKGSSYVTLDDGKTKFRVRKELLEEFKTEQNLHYALIAGIVSCLAGAILWAMVSMALQVQVGYMAIGVGALVGFSVRLAGKGMDPVYSWIGAGFSLLGCVLGNLFMIIGFVAEEAGVKWVDAFNLLPFSLMLELMKDNFSGMDLFFYLIALYEGYRFAPRKLSLSDLEKADSGEQA